MMISRPGECRAEGRLENGFYHDIAEMRFEGYFRAVGRPGPLRRRPLSTMQVE
jgi:hypothetical protein